MSKIVTTPTAAASSLVTLHITPTELAEIRSMMEHSIQTDEVGQGVTGIELAELAEMHTPAFLRKQNARFVAAAKAAGKDTWTDDPQEKSDRLKLTAGIVRKLVAAGGIEVLVEVDVDTALVRKARKLAKSRGLSLSQFLGRSLDSVIAEHAAKAA